MTCNESTKGADASVHVHIALRINVTKFSCITLLNFYKLYTCTCSTDWYDKTKINIQVQSECTMRKFRSIQMYMSLHGINAHTHTVYTDCNP